MKIFILTNSVGNFKNMNPQLNPKKITFINHCDAIRGIPKGEAVIVVRTFDPYRAGVRHLELVEEVKFQVQARDFILIETT